MRLQTEAVMPTIYISDRGDDKNDGLSLKTPVYSFKQAQKLQGGKNDYSWHFGPRAWERIKKELIEEVERRKKNEDGRGRSRCLPKPT